MARPWAAVAEPGGASPGGLTAATGGARARHGGALAEARADGHGRSGKGVHGCNGGAEPGSPGAATAAEPERRPWRSPAAATCRKRFSGYGQARQAVAIQAVAGRRIAGRAVAGLRLVQQAVARRRRWAATPGGGQSRATPPARSGARPRPRVATLTRALSLSIALAVGLALALSLAFSLALALSRQIVSSQNLAHKSVSARPAAAQSVA